MSRMALAVVSRAEQDGRLRPGDTVVEYTGGGTGASLALVCAARGYRIRIVTSNAFVHCVGTAASSRGVATVLKRLKPGVRIVVVEPAESAVLSGGSAGPHKIEGVGIGNTPPLWEPAFVGEVFPVGTEEAKDMTRRLAREEALFAGMSSGANVLAAMCWNSAHPATGRESHGARPGPPRWVSRGGCQELEIHDTRSVDHSRPLFRGSPRSFRSCAR